MKRYALPNSLVKILNLKSSVLDIDNLSLDHLRDIQAFFCRIGRNIHFSYKSRTFSVGLFEKQNLFNLTIISLFVKSTCVDNCFLTRLLLANLVRKRTHKSAKNWFKIMTKG